MPNFVQCVTNSQWIKNLNVTESCKDRLEEMALMAAGFGFEAIQMDVKIRSLRGMKDEEIQSRFDVYNNEKI